ncbi:glycerophosphodiester phosphodiesterase [Bacteroidota bacterium]
METLKEFVKLENFLIAAHRGASGKAPENTIAAFRLAVDLGANMIETDLQFTDDGHIVAYHDLDHIINNSKISHDNFNTLEKIKNIDAGAWFDPKFKGERIPQLEEILDFAKDRAYLNLEIKANEKSAYKKQLEQMIDIIYNFGFQYHLMFSSFNYGLLKLLKSIDSEIHTAAIKRPGQNHLPSQLANETGSEAFICSLDELNDDINRDVLENDLFLGVYSVDNEQQLEYAMKYNITALGTNYPGRIKKLLTKYL